MADLRLNEVGVEMAATVAHMREQLVERDEIIVALQQVIRDLRHEVVNLRVGERFRDLRHTNDSVSGAEGNGTPEGRIELALAEAVVAAYVDATRFYELALAKLAHQREERNDT